MKRIFGSIGTIAVISAALVGGTGAFFSDTEQSSGNTFAAGVIDLTIDNDSYYNRNRCAIDAQDIDTDLNVTEYLWQGIASYPVPGTNCSTSFPASDLGQGLLFFNFADLKPDDEGEDTISIHGGTNDAYACMDVVLTSNDDRSSNEPELDSGDIAEDINNTWDGELAQTLQMLWWADDGDNVLEDNESILSGGVQTIANLASTSGPFSVALADATHNVWASTTPGVIPGGQIRYVAKAWCFGTLAAAPLPAGQGVSPSAAPGVTCDGTGLGNGTQTDGLTLDVAFRAVQARHNTAFLCNEETTRTAQLTVIKVVTNDNGGNNVIADFQLFADNGVVPLPVTSNVQTEVTAGNYTITETGVSGYQASFSGDCNVSGQVTLAPGDVKTCTITNNDLPANITLIKNVINNNGGIATAQSAWGLKIDGTIVPNNSSQAVTSNVPHTINEDGRAGYTFVSITGSPECPAVLGGTATLDEGEAITCTITNDDNPPAP